MIVFGDAVRTESPREKLARVVERLAFHRGSSPGLLAHAALVSALIETGELVQGLADQEGKFGAFDAATPVQTAATSFLLTLARATWASWQGGFALTSPLDPADADRLSSCLPDTSVQTKLPEGFAFYAVYPESYAAAAAGSGLPASTVVIGLRSIGTTLGAMVAAAIATRDVAFVRPGGHPFRRELPLSPALSQQITAAHDNIFAVVDEGPGLSGSSFGAVADCLRSGGVATDRIVVFPSHGDAPGPQASESHRRWWNKSVRHVQTFDDTILHAQRREHRLETWVADVVGPLQEPLEDVSGGGWRRHGDRSEALWPPVNAHGERRKLLARSARGTWLVKFIGVGREGERKAARAQALAAAGFAPPVAGFRHGFLIERWLHGRSLENGGVDHARLAAWLGGYLSFRATRFAAPASGGASVEQLWEMARFNAASALGADIGLTFDRWSPHLPAFARCVRSVEVDGRLHRWEWLVLPDKVLKCDGVDHHAGHDLVGCQDIAWDLAGAAVELALPEAANEKIVAIVARETEREIDPDFLLFHRHCYLAFQLGAASMAADAAIDRDEERRWRREIQRYGTALLQTLAQTSP